MTWEVMATLTSRLQSRPMNKLLPALVFVPFAAFSSWVIATQGYFGFLTVAWREPWAMQVLLDLAIMVFAFGTWLRRDARAHGIAAAPYLIALPLLGSLAALVYLVHRGFKTAPRSAFETRGAKADLA